VQSAAVQWVDMHAAALSENAHADCMSAQARWASQRAGTGAREARSTRQAQMAAFAAGRAAMASVGHRAVVEKQLQYAALAWEVEAVVGLPKPKPRVISIKFDDGSVIAVDTPATTMQALRKDVQLHTGRGCRCFAFSPPGALGDVAYDVTLADDALVTRKHIAAGLKARPGPRLKMERKTTLALPTEHPRALRQLAERAEEGGPEMALWAALLMLKASEASEVQAEYEADQRERAKETEPPGTRAVPPGRTPPSRSRSAAATLMLRGNRGAGGAGGGRGTPPSSRPGTPDAPGSDAVALHVVGRDRLSRRRASQENLMLGAANRQAAGMHEEGHFLKALGRVLVRAFSAATPAARERALLLHAATAFQRCLSAGGSTAADPAVWYDVALVGMHSGQFERASQAFAKIITE
jgi:hypothetical protein